VHEVGLTLKTASEAFRTCRNGALQFQFSSSITRLETARRTLEKGRKEAQALRHSLEGVRKQLEATHARRNAGTREEAVANEQLYAERMLTEYVKPLDSALVPLIDQYTVGMTAYSQALTQYAEFCAKSGYTAAAGAAFVSGQQASIEGVASQSTQLLTAATEAKKSANGRAVSAK
jgi:exonuclease VII small subunit